MSQQILKVYALISEFNHYESFSEIIALYQNKESAINACTEYALKEGGYTKQEVPQGLRDDSIWEKGDLILYVKEFDVLS